MRPIKLKIHTEDFTPDVDDILRKLPDQQRKRIAHLEDVLTRRYKAQSVVDFAWTAGKQLFRWFEALGVDEDEALGGTPALGQESREGVQGLPLVRWHGGGRRSRGVAHGEVSLVRS